jgi:hypothetical protein
MDKIRTVPTGYRGSKSGSVRPWRAAKAGEARLTASKGHQAVVHLRDRSQSRLNDVNGSVVSTTNQIAVYGPVRTVVWEGSGREAAPYPDSGSVVRFAGLVITSTAIDNLVVCRARPNVVKKTGWESRISDNRYLFEKSKPSGQIFTVSL